MKYRCQADAYVLQALCGGAHTQFDSTEFTSTSTNSCSKDLLSISFPSPPQLLPPPFLPVPLSCFERENQEKKPQRRAG